ncbi:enoyl-CoA hydratase/isomerase family protein [Martelella sp. HB161492]|uniref:enoyl-CoA hydratase/isomerase family protein n=1 Tax=Martelella sp. HB161492 TaxID=2720726 RepID=UPI00159084DC|nr:enoyl-CoA hydratase/isomerase family protein [Martelella sp. HB161492]
MPLTIEKADGFLVVAFQWTTTEPGFQTATFQELSNILEEANRSPEIACVLFTSSGRSFCDGSDIRSFLNPADLDELNRSSRVYFDALINSQIPLVAAVNGPAIGIGMTMLLHFDVVLASPASEFRSPFVEWGLVPESASSQILPELTGLRNAFSIFALGKALSAKDAKSAGIVSEIVDHGDLEQEARLIATRLAKLPRQSLRKTRWLLHQKNSVDERVALENEIFVQLLHDEVTQKRLSLLARVMKRGKASRQSDPHRRELLENCDVSLFQSA